jgi:Homing endonuclease associated repeat/HNH endonuclease
MFELPPNNRNQSDEVLLDDLRAIAKVCGGNVLTREKYAMNGGRFATATVANRFGGWGKALAAAGLPSARHFSVSRDEVISDLQQVAGIVNQGTVTVKQYAEHGQFSKAVARHFGSWRQALAASGLATSKNFYERASDDQLFENLEVVWQSLGRAPVAVEMDSLPSRFSKHRYKRRFGTWRKALEAFVAAAGAEQRPSSAVAKPAPTTTAPQRSRSVGWRLKWLVMKRDNFRCRACGRSPATHAGTVLHVDHVVAWANGGLTVEWNLQTLCEECNIGKGATTESSSSCT